MANEKETKEEVKKEPLTVKINTEKHGDFIEKLGYKNFEAIADDESFLDNVIERAQKNGHGGAKAAFDRSLLALSKELGVAVEERDLIDNDGKPTTAIFTSKIKSHFNSQLEELKAAKAAGNIDPKDAKRIEEAIEEAKKQAIEARKELEKELKEKLANIEKERDEYKGKYAEMSERQFKNEFVGFMSANFPKTADGLAAAYKQPAQKIVNAIYADLKDALDIEAVSEGKFKFSAKSKDADSAKIPYSTQIGGKTFTLKTDGSNFSELYRALLNEYGALQTDTPNTPPTPTVAEPKSDNKNSLDSYKNAYGIK